jgi:phage I-like protein
MDATLIVCSDTGAVIDAASRSWVEVLVTTNGQVVQNHRKFVLTRADLETCAAQIRAQGDKLPLDYDHSYVENGNTVASGWFVGEAQVLAAGESRPNGTAATEDELWALVEWTPQAADDIRAKRYRFISAEFRFGEVVKGVAKTVKEFVAATLTNRPFFGRMEAVTLSRIDTDAAGLTQFLNDPPEASATDAEWRAWAEQQVSTAKAAESAYTGREATTEGAEMDTTVLAKSLGLADDATEEQITAKLAEVSEKASEAEALTAKVAELENGADKSELETLREELKTERTKRLEGERDTILTSAISEGRMLPAEKEPLVEAFGENVEGLKKVLDARPKNTVLARERGGNGGGNGEPETDAAVEEFTAADGTPVDEDSAALHAKAIQILGKDDYTQDEYLVALKKAERSDAVTA